MENPQKKRRKSAKRTDIAYDEYVANVSGGMNPPSTAKRRRKKKVDEAAYDRYLEETAAQAEESRVGRSRRAEEKHPDDVKPRRRKKAEQPREDYDAYLLREDAAEEAAPPRPRRKKRSNSARRRRARRRKLFSALYIAAMVMILIGFGVLAVQQYQIYQDYREMRATVEDQRFYEGTTVDGYDLSGMTLEEAQAFFAGSVEPQHFNRAVYLTTGEMFTAEQLGYTSNYYTVLRAAWSAGRNGTLQERYDAIVNGDHAAAAHTVTRTFCTDDTVRNAVATIAGYTDQPFTEPQIDGFDAEKLTFTLDDGKPGYTLDQQKLVSDIVHVMNSGGGDVAPVINAIPVEVDPEKLVAGYGRISFISTDASTSSSNRLTNLYLSCTAINGTRLEPGDEFSFNGIVGQRTEAKGYKEAGVYNGGADGMDIGGGICQVGSTLFNAAVMADMEITDRRPHSKPVSYLPRGRDAAINWPETDLKFVNTSSGPVYVVTRLTENKQVECAIYGKLPEDGHTVKLESYTYESIPYETILELNPRLPAGTHEVIRKGRKGYKAQTWKITYDANGNEISKEHLCYSKYGKQDELIHYNP